MQINSNMISFFEFIKVISKRKGKEYWRSKHPFYDYEDSVILYWNDMLEVTKKKNINAFVIVAVIINIIIVSIIISIFTILIKQGQIM